MRIAVNTRLLLPKNMEGIGRFIHEILRRWVASQPETEFIFLFDRDFDPKFVYGQNVRPVKLFPPARHPFLYPIFFEWAVARFLKREKCDLFVSLDGFNCLRTDTKSLFLTHDLAYLHHHNHTPWLTQKYYEYFVPRFIRKATQLATVSEFSKLDICQKMGVAAEKIAVIYNGVNELYQPLPKSEKEQIKAKFSDGKDYFIFIASIHPRKNLVRQLLAFEDFKQKTGSDMRFLVVGRMAWNNSELNELLPTLKYCQDIQFLGYQDSENLAKLLAAAFALMYVSLLEGFGVPIAESIACHVPVICGNNSSMPEVLGKAGLLVEAENVQHISSAMQSLYTLPNLYQKCVEHCQAQAGAFSWERSAAALWELALATIHKP